MKLFENINFNKLKEGLSKTRDKLFNKVTEVFTGKAVLSEEMIEELEEILLSSDLGAEIVTGIIDNLKRRMKSESDRSGDKAIQIVKESLVTILENSKSAETYSPAFESKKPFVILIVGVNGAGKTTTIGKLANNFKNAGLTTVVGAADTFRAAANEQLEIWADRANVKLIQKSKGSDPGAVAFETIEYAVNNKADVVIIDTAGRLHTKTELMEELKKINNVVKKKIPDAPHETLLVIDGTTGQNGLRPVSYTHL
ncbi:MAG: signal recognition particle-docking protein FtsY, partial [Ignavibacteriaceae bacterium]|nr:signal recognition particle-docking protein FtsY [Ignavibacteriaceae bacterium]